MAQVWVTTSLRAGGYLGTCGWARCLKAMRASPPPSPQAGHRSIEFDAGLADHGAPLLRFFVHITLQGLGAGAHRVHAF